MAAFFCIFVAGWSGAFALSQFVTGEYGWGAFNCVFGAVAGVIAYRELA